MLGRTMGLDVGDVRIGVALSDPLGIICSPHSVITCQSPEKDVEAVRALAEESGTIRIVVGLPLHQSGEKGTQAHKVEAFVERLREVCPLEIVYQDERFTSALAERALVAANVRRQDRKKVIDKVAAQQILQTWMDRAARAKKD